MTLGDIWGLRVSLKCFFSKISCLEEAQRCVSKSWHSLISDSKFAKTHFSLASSNTDYNHDRLLLSLRSSAYCPLDLKSCSISAIMYEQSHPAVSLDCPYDGPPNWFWIEGSCNGCPVYGFGYDESIDDYKAVVIFQVQVNKVERQNRATVYTLRTDSWRRIGDFPHPFELIGPRYFASGALHWILIVGSKEIIVSLDLATETYGEVPQPECVHSYHNLIMDVLCTWWHYLFIRVSGENIARKLHNLSLD
ncbi:hypothetical protein RHSIM_Rhsim02G0055900 [Rhododendron simsii]|uniref:F-box associated beta-propeller type 1 domain-containing protein n=1 Tax=Rhododendron simsii TaxID=118357 RepID=A0A834HCF3_RHOSS|nr:hypothetical protein RHSIM_Rhsim02G0055900 [Rhododendron simsii]